MIVLARVLLDVLFSSIWQGASIAIAVAVVLAVVRRRLNAATRYAVMASALVALAVIPVVTTVPNVTPHTAQVSMRSASGTTGSGAYRDVWSAVRVLSTRRIDVALSDRAVIALIGTWMIGVLAFTLRMVIGSLQLARLLRRSKRLADRNGVRIFASPDVGVPLTIGFVRPSVIVPSTLAAVDAAQEFECAVLHEIAHVRRRDVWSNACGRALHALLFFNPAALLLLRAAALEREASCDDLAVAESRDLDAYTRSLATLAVRAARANPPVGAFGVAGFSRSAVTRIERLADTRRNGATTLSRFTLGGFTIVLAFIALALQSFAPAVAFAPHPPIATTVVASTACSKPARIVRPTPPNFPNGAHGITHKLTTLVDVHLSSSGRVLGVTIFKSSGRADLDRATLAAARESTYAPGLLDCKPAAGTYRFIATFQPGAPLPR